MKTYFLTGNKGKFEEVESYIPGIIQYKSADIPEIQSLDLKEVIFEKLKSAVKVFKKDSAIINFNLIVEDTGLYLDSLNQFPGPLIKHMLTSVGNEGIFRICTLFENFEAKAITIFGVYNSVDDKIRFYSGQVEGKITSPRGEYGFGWDSIFKPDGTKQTFAEMSSIDLKNQYSMRQKALVKLVKSLKS